MLFAIHIIISFLGIHLATSQAHFFFHDERRFSLVEYSLRRNFRLTPYVLQFLSLSFASERNTAARCVMHSLSQPFCRSLSRALLVSYVSKVAAWLQNCLYIIAQFPTTRGPFFIIHPFVFFLHWIFSSFSRISKSTKTESSLSASLLQCKVSGALLCALSLCGL